MLEDLSISVSDVRNVSGVISMQEEPFAFLRPVLREFRVDLLIVR
jgi:hypothetical protein